MNKQTQVTTYNLSKEDIELTTQSNKNLKNLEHDLHPINWHSHDKVKGLKRKKSFVILFRANKVALKFS
jgi:hypothetical protein